ncbi:M20/M25/M40 family metallo-hydrolase [Puteibacter caeruleilacunae]|nr:M20/M25/M40 family metallo-hydrolase [Puteibacter caeruleilacunae]
MKYLFLLILLCSSEFLFAQRDLEKTKAYGSITMERISGQLEFLSSDWMEGREAGKEGGYLAGDYLASEMKVMGLSPMGDMDRFEPNRYQKLSGLEAKNFRSFYQKFDVLEASPSDKHQLSVQKSNNGGTLSLDYEFQTDFSLGIVSESNQLQGDVVFVGYGFENEHYSDFEGVDVAGKIIVRITGYPGETNPESVAAQKMGKQGGRGLTRKKNEVAQKLGALAVLEYDFRSDITKKWASNAPFRFNEAMYEGDSRPESFYSRRLIALNAREHTMPVVQISKKVFQDLIRSFNQKDFKRKTDNLESVSYKMTDTKATVKTVANTQLLKVRNIVGMIEGKNPNKYIVVGAHYDHLGKYNGHIWNGADDNGSGVVAVLSLANAFKQLNEKPDYTMIFACWDAEEKGLHGSKYFVNQFAANDSTLFYLNFDMVGRDSGPDASGKDVALMYTKASPEIEKMSKKNVKGENLKLKVNYSAWANPTSGSDNAPFAKAGVPIAWFHTGGHVDYHKPSDHVEVINWTKLQEIIRLSFLNLWDLAYDKQEITDKE